MSTIGKTYLESVIKRFAGYKEMGDRTFAQLTNDSDYLYAPNPASNSLAIIIRHMSGNMLSRWTNFLTEDGEKPWRNRDSEFNADPAEDTRASLLARWEKGWTCLLETLKSLQEEDLKKTIHIRHEPLIVIDAINRQLAHYPHHVGQIVYIGKILKGDAWISLSIAKGQSDHFNREMKDKHA